MHTDCCASLARDENFPVDFHVELVPISASGIALRNLPLRHHSFGKPGTQVRDIEVNTQALLICGLLAVALESSPQREAGVSASPSCIAWPACAARRWFKAELHGADDIAIHARLMIYTLHQSSLAQHLARPHGLQAKRRNQKLLPRGGSGINGGRLRRPVSRLRRVVADRPDEAGPRWCLQCHPLERLEHRPSGQAVRQACRNNPDQALRPLGRMLGTLA